MADRQDQNGTDAVESAAGKQRPRLPIRRFDVFAEYNRQKAIQDGIAEDEAAGYGLWVAKVVASRSFGRSISSHSPQQVHKMGQGKASDGGMQPHEKWHSLEGQPQTDDLFEKEIVKRMGAGFYNDIFVLAIKDALQQGKSYQSIRDTLRKGWTV